VYWQCPKSEDHVYQRIIYVRTAKAAPTCPFCSGRIVDKSTALASVHPDIAKEWHPAANGESTRQNVKWNSTERVWWRCNKHHEWQAEVYYRTKHGNRCPQCSGWRANENTSLAALRPDLAAEWHPNKNRLLNPDIKGTYKSSIDRQNQRLP